MTITIAIPYPLLKSIEKQAGAVLVDPHLLEDALQI
jgi:hypothetical protein